MFFRTECFSARNTACFSAFPQCADRQTVGRKERVLMIFFFLRNGLFHDAEKPVPQCYKASSGRLNGLFGTPETSGRHDGGVFMVRLNVFSCPVIMFPQHRVMAFTGMCFNLKLLIAGTLIRLKESGADSAYTRRAFIIWFSGRCGI